MKKLFFLVVCVSLFFVACKQKDSQPPMIFLNGSNPMNVTLNSWWTDPGVTVDDNVDGESLINAVEVTHNIEINGPANGEGETKLVGIYTVTYTVKDKAGNTTTETRTVNVVNSAEKYATAYVQTVDALNENMMKDTVYPNSVTLSFDNRINNRIFFPKLGGPVNPLYPTNTIRVYGDIKIKTPKDSILIPNQKFAFFEGGVRYLYSVTGVVNSSWVQDSIDPYLILNYQVDKLKYDNVLGTVSWNDSLWKVVKNDFVNETYERY